ncbi:MAG: ATP-binding protein [Gammaproteobacteria bacterium]|nr:ATP-binding protein [Gammaproteobacteria bacterium]
MNEFNETLPLADFDREMTLHELLSSINIESLASSIEILLGDNYCLKTSNDEVVMGRLLTGETRLVEIRPELESVGCLIVEKNIDDKLVDAVRKILELLLKSSIRYLMASDLHLQTVQSDYHDLKKKHQALQESEDRYKDLAENLECRVAEQVKTIDRAQRQLYQAEKLASVGQLAAGVAHEINNPVGFIQSNLAVSKKYVEDFFLFSEILGKEDDVQVLRNAWKQLDLDFTVEDFKNLIDESLDGAKRVTKIVSQLKEFSNVDHSKVEIIDVNDRIVTACNIAELEINKKAELIQSLSTLPGLKCQSGQLSQVFLNILLNAKQAVGVDGRIVVTSLYRDGNIIVEISDNGPGISADSLSRIFDPFYTTKDVGEGTGLGLTVSRDIIVNHDGDIVVESKKGEGTTVRISLPVKT